MSMELIYTSAPRGLKPGTRGFATVAMTQGMPPQLVERLESLSGYRQVFAPQDPQAGLNPVVQSHLRNSVAGRNFHVLSRISAAGLDYSQRANKFAHHLVLDASELPPGGPAWLLAQPGVFSTSWSGEPRLLASRRPPSGNTAAGICRHWQQLTGDAGWGGALAEAAIGISKSQVTIIFRPGMDPLPLIAESLALLPPEQRWNVTFSSYYTKLPPGVECNWRCVLEGSPESKGAAGLVIDLCRPLGTAQGGALVTAARTGKPPIAKPATTTVTRPSRAAPPDDLELELLLQPVESAAARDDKRVSVAATTPVATLETLPPALPQGISFSAPTSSSIPRGKPRLKHPPRWPIITAVVAFASIAVAGIVLFIFTRRENDVARNGSAAAKPQSAAEAADKENADKEKADKEKADKEKADKEKADKEKADKEKADKEKADKEKADKEKTDKQKADKEKADKEKADKEEADKEKVERRKLKLLSDAVANLPEAKGLPPTSAFTQSDRAKSWSFPMQLTPEMSVGVELFGGKGLDGGYHLDLLPGESRIWDVRFGTVQQTTAIGSFSVAENTLRFNWKRGIPSIPQAAQLANCLLQVKLDLSGTGQARFVALREPIPEKPLRFAGVDFRAVKLGVDVQPKRDVMPEVELILSGSKHVMGAVNDRTQGDFDIDKRVRFHTRVHWDELTVEYVGVEVPWQVPEDSLLRHTFRAPPERTKLQLGPIAEFIDLADKESTRINDQLMAEQKKLPMVGGQMQQPLIDSIARLNGQLARIKHDKADAESLQQLFSDLQNASIGYRVFFTVTVDGIKHDVNVVKTTDLMETHTAKIVGSEPAQR